MDYLALSTNRKLSTWSEVCSNLYNGAYGVYIFIFKLNLSSQYNQSRYIYRFDINRPKFNASFTILYRWSTCQFPWHDRFTVLPGLHWINYSNLIPLYIFPRLTDEQMPLPWQRHFNNPMYMERRHFKNEKHNYPMYENSIISHQGFF